MEKFKEMNMDNMDRIELDPKVCNRKPIIRGTRIPVSIILERVAENEPWESILNAYPELGKEDIQAALLIQKSAWYFTSFPKKL